jgi:hypothetical protein
MSSPERRPHATAARAAWLAAALVAGAPAAHAAEIGHFNGGVLNLGDYVMPEPGVYAALYPYFYTTDRPNDGDGDRIDQVTVRAPGGGASVTLDVDVDVDMVALSPTPIYATELPWLELRYGALAAPSFANFSLEGGLSVANGRGGNVDAHSVGAGDLYVQPLWLARSFDHWDLGFAYGFWAPVGRYDTERVALLVVGPVKVEASDNVGFGFFSQQLQGSAAWYPMERKGTVLVGALTFETHGEKEGFDLTPGEDRTLNWGASQMLPLCAKKSLLLELALVGYDTWQLSDDSGSDADGTRDPVHAIGGRLGVTHLPWGAALNLHGFYEYAARNRFQGGSFGASLVKKSSF